MTGSFFLFTSLALAGFQAPPEDLLTSPGLDPTENANTITEFRQRFDRSFTLAAHRSHSSHRSHGSHRSHRSSSGGGYSPSPSRPAPSTRPAVPAVPGNRNLDSTPPSSVLPGSPAIAPEVQQRLRGNSEAFRELARRVQLALYARGFYTGAIDGIPGPMTAAAITGFERSQGLTVTGRITDDLLDALAITGY